MKFTTLQVMVVGLGCLSLARGQSERWVPTRVERIAVPSASLGGAVLGGSAYFFGGTTGAPHDYRPETQTARLESMGGEGAGIVELRGAPRLQSSALVAFAGRLFRIGGLEARGEGDLHSTAEVASWAPGEGAWRAESPLPEGRSSHEAVVWGDTLIVVAGWSVSGRAKDAVWHESMLAGRIVDGRLVWENLGKAPFSRRAVAAAVVGDDLFVVGGLEETGGRSFAADRYDLRTRAWSPAPRLPEHGFGASAVAVGGRLLVSLPSGQLVEPRGEGWATVGSLLAPRSFHRLVEVKGEVVVAGGRGRSGLVTTVEGLSHAPTSETRIAHLRLDYPGRARNRQSLLVHDRKLLFLGGNAAAAQHAFEPQSFVDEFWSLDLGTLQFEALPPTPSARQAPFLTNLGDSFAVWGGFGHDGTTARTLGEGFVLDPSTKFWSRAEALDLARSQCGVVSVGNMTWVLGGWNWLGREDHRDPFAGTQEVLARDAALTTKWTRTGHSLPRLRRACGAAELEGRIYLVGGLGPQFAPVTEVDMLDIQSRTWSQGPKPHHHRVGGELIAVGGRLFLLGGSREGPKAGKFEADRSIEVLDPAMGRFELLLENHLLPPEHLRAVAIGSRLLLVSTHGDVAGTLRMAWVDPGVSRPLERALPAADPHR